MLHENEVIKAKVSEIIDSLVAQNLDSLMAKGYLSARDIPRIKEEISHYGRTLIPVPQKAFESACEYNLGQDNWRFEIQLWTKEEGESDLTLILDIQGAKLIDPSVRVIQVHVL